MVESRDSDRFAFGKNWLSFLDQLDSDRVQQATESLCDLLGYQRSDENRQPFAGKRFLDIGSGSGLFSLAAVTLGAAVVSVDYDADSVACAERLREQLRSQPIGATADWQIYQGSVLDAEFMRSLGTFDVVYSWGVLHHTGDMTRALEIASGLVEPNGQLAIAIYNDQGGNSRRWLKIKQAYHRLPNWLRPALVGVVAGFYELKFALARLARLQNPLPFADWKAKRSDRGMSVWHDWVDWIGGLPFEVARPEEIILPIHRAGMKLENMTTVGSGWGCNQYVFRR